MIKKIAVLRANALGDYIFVLPALQALREKFPDAEIIYLGKHWHKQFISSRPGPVDRVIVVPPYPGIGEPEDFIPDPRILDVFFEAMQKEAFDLTFQLHGGGKNSNPFLLRLGAKSTIGLKTPDAVSLDINVPYVYYFSEILRYLEVVSKVDATTTDIEPQVQATEKDVAEAKEFLINHQQKPLAVIHPGASDLRRRWPGENFAQIAGFLIKKGYLVYLTGTPSEQEITDKLAEQINNKNEMLNLCGKLSLNGLTGLLSLADLVISNDTGPLHLARALNRPTVGIFWFSNSITGLSVTTSIHRTLPSFTVNCPLCGLPVKKIGKSGPTDCEHRTSFVADVSVEEVQSAIAELIDFIKTNQNPVNLINTERV